MNHYLSIINQDWKVKPLLNFPIKHFTSYKCQGTIDVVLTISDNQELYKFLQLSSKIPFIILGKGSNCLFTDTGFAGIIVQLGGSFEEIKVDQQNKQLICGSACLDKEVARQAKKLSWSGCEFLMTIPGKVGGGIYMNAGAHKKCFADIVVDVSGYYLNGQVFKLTNKDCDFAYRKSIFKQKNNAIISHCRLQLQNGNIKSITDLEKKLLKYRKDNQPIDKLTFGSVFTNPQKFSAGQLIEAAGLKGKGYGQAQISLKHANFIENLGQASFKDVLDTIRMVYQEVYKKFNIKLQLEVQIIDKDGQKKKLDDFF